MNLRKSEGREMHVEIMIRNILVSYEATIILRLWLIQINIRKLKSFTGALMENSWKIY